MVLVGAEILGLTLIVIAFCAARRLLTHAAEDLMGGLAITPQRDEQPPDELADGSWDGASYDNAIWGDPPEQRVPTFNEKERKP
jgi:hypothetical protein